MSAFKVKADNGWRRPRWDEHAKPLVKDEPLDTGFLKSRHIGQLCERCRDPRYVSLLR